MKKVPQILMAALLTVSCGAVLTACDGIADPARQVRLVESSVSEKSGSFELSTHSSGENSTASEGSQTSHPQSSGSAISIMEFFTDYDGMDVMSAYGEELAGNDYDVDIYLGKNDQVIYDFTLKTEYNKSKLNEARSELETKVNSQKSSIVSQLDRFVSEYHLQPFSVLMQFRNADRTLLYEVEISSSQG